MGLSLNIVEDGWSRLSHFHPISPFHSEKWVLLCKEELASSSREGMKSVRVKVKFPFHLRVDDYLYD